MAKTIYFNANIVTMNPEVSRATAMCVGTDGRIVAIGSMAEVEGIVDAETKRVNLNGKTIIPGFYDCHLHILWLGKNLGHVNLSSPPVQSSEDIISLLRQRRAEKPDLTCLQGNRYDQNRLTTKKHITRHDLDKVATDIPVRVVHTSGHAAVVNSCALRMLGIDAGMKDPIGGKIERNENGEPTGVLLETASWMNLEKILPATTDAEKREALGRASDYLLERGITSATDANTEPNDIDCYAEAFAQHKLRVRTNLMVSWAELVSNVCKNKIPSPLDIYPNQELVNKHQVHVGQAKLFADGAITTRTCWLRQAFSDMPDNFGIPIHEGNLLTEYIESAHQAGWQIATHAIGDAAIDAVLSIYAKAQSAYPSNPHKHRIEHAMLLDDELIERFRSQQVWAIGQPEFLSRLGDAYIDALGEERAARLSPYASLNARGVMQAFSSDCPVVPGAPLDGMLAAMQRKTASGRILNAEERVSVETALYSYTLASAMASNTDMDRGTLARSKWADFVVLSADPIVTSLEEWERVTILATFVGGECQFGGVE